MESYMELRQVEQHDITRRKSSSDSSTTDSSLDYEDLDRFGETLSRISRYNALKPLATLSYTGNFLSNSNIVSSIAFDKDNEFFAIAGVARKIKLFEYATVISSAAVDVHYPTQELECGSKISCVAWSSYFQNRLASSDYGGCVSLWDIELGIRNRVLSEHEQRVWSVDWSNSDPRLFASGSDDSKVKLWTTQTERSIQTIEAEGNVCSVEFSPEKTFEVVFGTSDHYIHYYDFRNPKQPLSILSGHTKAVSYVKFMSNHELVSASVDSKLKVWNLEALSSQECVRTFTGHSNEKNFVGLATDGKYIAAGSEDNSVYVYYRHLSHPLFYFTFDNYRNMATSTPKKIEDDPFISAMVWKKGSPVMVAANSQGSIKILELV